MYARPHRGARFSAGCGRNANNVGALRRVWKRPYRGARGSGECRRDATGAKVSPHFASSNAIVAMATNAWEKAKCGDQLCKVYAGRLLRDVP